MLILFVNHLSDLLIKGWTVNYKYNIKYTIWQLNV